jgi:excisionase family DNA binding protein
MPFLAKKLKTNEHQYWTPDQVGRLLQVKPLTVRLWLRHGLLKGHKFGKVWRIYKPDLDTFLASERNDDSGDNYNND